ncbi:MAG: DUF4199 domain-containing protein [Tannerellaceae bacterium]|jgi:hypothetical protein|nr:DUF4199 domain-containing protein [Tannerellaceae bacterium]
MKNKKLLLWIALYYGRPLGLFWVVKYVFFVLGVSLPWVGIIYWILTPLTLFLSYMFTDICRRRLGGRITFAQAWGFGVLLYFFSAVIVSLAHFVFYRYIASPDYLASVMQTAAEMLTQINPQMQETLRATPLPTPMDLTLQDIVSNTFYGALFSIPVAARLRRKTNQGFIPPARRRRKPDKQSETTPQK